MVLDVRYQAGEYLACEAVSDEIISLAIKNGLHGVQLIVFEPIFSILVRAL